MDIEKRRSFIINAVYFLFWGVIAVFLLKYALPLLSPFVIAFVLAYVLRRPVRWIAERTRISDKLVSLAVVALFFVAVGGLLTLLGFKAVDWLGGIISRLPAIYADHLQTPLMSFFDWLDRLLGRFDITLAGLFQEVETQLIQTLGQLVSGVSSYAMSLVSGVVTAMPGLFLRLVLLIISTFFITIDYVRITGFFYAQFVGHSRQLMMQIKQYLLGTLWVCIRSYAIIMFITFVELSIGLSIIRIRYAIPLAALISVLDILPVLGTGTVLIPWCVISLVQGKYSLALGLILVYVAITVIRNIIEPKIVGGQLGLHPLVTLASMFAGLQLLGIWGLFGFPIALSLVRHLNDRGIIRLFNPVDAPENPENTPTE